MIFLIKKITICSLVLLVFTAPLAAAELKIAVLDTQRAIAQSEEVKSLLEIVQEELQSEQENVNTLGDEIRSLREQLVKDGEVMSPTEQRKAQKTLEDKGIDYQFLVNKLQKQANDRQQEVIQVMAPKLQAVLRDLIDLEGYDLILEAGVLYVNSKHDITRRVTEKLNEKRE